MAFHWSHGVTSSRSSLDVSLKGSTQVQQPVQIAVLFSKNYNSVNGHGSVPNAALFMTVTETLV